MSAHRSKTEVAELAGRASRMAADLCYFFNVRYGVFSDDWPECGEKRAYRLLTDAALMSYRTDASNEWKYNALRDAIRFAETLGTQQVLF